MGDSVLFPLNWSRAHRNVNTSALEVSFSHGILWNHCLKSLASFFLASVCPSPHPPSLPSPRLAQSEAGVDCEYYWMESWKYFYWCENKFPKNSQGLFFSMTFTVLLDVVPGLPQASPSGFLRWHLPASWWEFSLFLDPDPLAYFKQTCGFPAYRYGMLLPLPSKWNPTGSSTPNFGLPHSEYSFLTSLSNQKSKDTTAPLAVK